MHIANPIDRKRFRLSALPGPLDWALPFLIERMLTQDAVILGKGKLDGVNRRKPTDRSP